MAFATVDRHSSSSAVVVPVVDLHVLTQSELYTLSLASSSSASAGARCDDDVLIPKIDRSVFNESAGSRKQTFSRLRLAPRNSSNYKSALPPPRQSQPLISPPPPPLYHESHQTITLLKQLFPSECYQNDDVFVPTPVQYRIPAAPPPAYVESAVVEASSTPGKRKRGRPRKDSYAVPPVVISGGLADEANVGNAGVEIEKRDGEAMLAATFVLNSEGKLVQSSPGKRKRGRPRKDEVRIRDENNAVMAVKKESVNKKVMKVEEGEMVLGNSNDAVVDSDAVAADGDRVFVEELRRRTVGLESEAELLGFLEGIPGVWSSARKKRKVVIATELGDLLPKGWRILLSLKRHGGHKSIVVRRYISPDGQEFLSCKEVSSYLDSYFKLGSQSKPVHTDDNIQVSNKMVMGDGMQYDANGTYEDNNNNNGHELDGCSLMPITSMKSSEASGEIMGKPKKLDPIRSGRLGTSLKNQELVEKDREPTSGTVARYDLSPGFSQGKVNDILADCFGSYNDESVSLSHEEKSMKVDKNCFSDGLNNVTRVCISSVDVPKVDIESDSNDVGKELGADNSDNHQSTSTIEDMKIDDVDNSGNARSGISENHIGPDTNIDQQSTSEACSLAPSMLVESVHKRGSESGLYNTATDDKICAVSNDVNSDSLAAICTPTCDDIGLSGSYDKVVSFGSCSNVQPLDEQSCISVNNATNTSCTAEEFWQEKSVASNSLTSYGNKQSLDDLKAGIHTAKGPRVYHAKNYNDTVTLSNMATENTGTISCIEQERRSTGYSVTSYANEHASVLKNNFGCNDITEELKQDETDLVCPSGYRQSHNLENNPNSSSSRSIEESNEQVKRSWSDEVLLGFSSSTHSGLEVSAMSSTLKNKSSLGPSPVLPEDNQTFPTCSDIFSRSVIDDKLIRDPVNGLGYPSVSEQTPGFVNNLNRVYCSNLWERSVSEGTENLRNNEAGTGFLNDCEPSADSMSELLWRIGGKNVHQTGLPDTNFVQPSANFVNFDMLSGKDANGAFSLNENFDNIPGFEGLKSGGLEEFEHCFPPAQASSQLKESNILSYDERTEQRFHSSNWLENEARPSMPNVASRREMISCVWCRNEFYHDYEAGMQTGSVGFMCENCQGKFSGHVNFP